MNLWGRINWRVDLLIHRLWYWRWSPRLKRDPDLAYIFAKLGAAWTNGHPPHDPAKLDAFIVSEFLRHGKRPTLNPRIKIKPNGRPYVEQEDLVKSVLERTSKHST